MTAFSENEHPRVGDGRFAPKTQSNPDVTFDSPGLGIPLFGSYPVKLAELPDAEVYRLHASALRVGAAGQLVPYFSEMEMQRVIEPINGREAGSDTPENIRFHGDSFYLHTGVESLMLPQIDTPTGRIFALHHDTGNNEFEIIEGEWFEYDGVVKNGLPVISDNAIGDSYDRSWTMRRDDGRYVTRTVTWFVEDFDDDSQDPDDPAPTPTYTVWRRTTDSISDVVGGELTYIDDEFAEDEIAADTIYDHPKWADERARICATDAAKGPYLDGWDGYDEWTENN